MSIHSSLSFLAATTSGSATIYAALSNTAYAFGCLSTMVSGNQLTPAILYRARLESVRRMAAAEGKLIDPWHLAAIIEGLRLRLDDDLRIIDRGMAFDAAREALQLHQWLKSPDPEQEAAILEAASFLRNSGDAGGPFVTAGLSLHRWLDNGRGRTAIWAALPQYWVVSGALSAPFPITGAASLSPDNDWDLSSWLPAFLRAVGEEAQTYAEITRATGVAWRKARQAASHKRRSSATPAAIDLLAAAPALSATSLSQALGIAPKNATRILEDLLERGVIVELSQRAKRRLFALPVLLPIQEAVAPPRAPEPGRPRGRPRKITSEDEILPAPSQACSSEPIEHFSFDYSELDAAMSSIDDTLRKTKSFLDSFTTTASKAHDED